MKRAIAILLLCAILTLAAACGSNVSDPSAQLAEEGLIMAQKMDELASSLTYIESMSASAELSATVTKMGDGDYASPSAIYKLTIPEDGILALMGAQNLGLSDELSDWATARAYAAIPNQLIARSGAAELAASSIVAYSDSFVCDGISSPVLLLYQYDGAYSVMASFRPGQDGAVSGSTLFVQNANLPSGAQSAEELAAGLGELFGIQEITAESVTLP